jgi:hypothetical protein
MRMAAIPLRAFGAILAGCGAAAGAYVFSRTQESPGPHSVLKDNALPAAHDKQTLGSDHCDCSPLWECMQAKCRGELCSECAPLEQQLRACMAKVRQCSGYGFLQGMTDCLMQILSAFFYAAYS